jgi:hypothetical protein
MLVGVFVSSAAAKLVGTLNALFSLSAGRFVAFSNPSITNV